MKLDGFLLDNDKLNGVDNEADNWQVNNFQILDKIRYFWRFAYFFGTFHPLLATYETWEG